MQRIELLRQSLLLRVQIPPRGLLGPEGEDAQEGGAFPCIATSQTNPSHVLPSPFPKGDALRDSGGHGTSERGLVVEQGIIACGHSGGDSHLQVPRWRSVRMTRRLIFWSIAAMSASLGDSTVTKRGVRPWSVRCT